MHDALSYAYGHPEEMAYHEERHKIRNVMRDLDLVLVDHRLIPRARLALEKVPAGAIVYDWQTLPTELES